MSTRVVEGKKPYTGGEAIDINEDKVISLKLRDENNLIIYDEGDDEIYVDLQLPNEIEPTDAFPVGVNTGRVIVDNGWDKTGTLISAKTTSGDNIQLLYADDGTLWIDNGTGTFKQIYFKGDVDDIVTTLTEYIDAHDTVVSDTAPSDPYEGELWYDTVNDTLKVYNGSTWVATGGGGGTDIEYKTQAEYDALPSSKLTDNKHYFIYSTSGGGGWQPGVNTIVYYPLDSTNTVNDLSGNGYNLTNAGGVTFGTNAGVDCAYFNYSYLRYSSLSTIPQGNAVRTVSYYVYCQQTDKQHFQRGSPGSDYAFGTFMGGNNHLYITTYGGLGLEGTVDMTNAWHYVTITHDGATLKLYIDGQLNNSVNGTLNTNGTDFYIGHCTWVGSWNFDKYISNFIVEDKAWTAQEVADYYDQTKANYGIS